MAKIVCIAEGTVREGVAEIGDIVSVHDDNVELTGSGYENFTIYELPGLTAAQVQESLRKVFPDITIAFKSNVATGIWAFDEPERKEVWKDADGKWRFLEAKPKYDITLADMTEVAKTSLEDDKVSAATRILTLESQAKEKISTDAKNLVEAVDLNKAVAEEPK